MPLRYQPGDRVIVRQDLREHERYYMDGNDEDAWYYANDEMRSLGGETVVIRGVNRNDPRAYAIQSSSSRCNNCTWTDEMFEGLEEDNTPLPEAHTDWDRFDW